MLFVKTLTVNSLFIISLMSLLSCSGHRPSNLGIHNNQLTTCPTSPNCVSSDAFDDGHKVAPFHFNAAATDTWKKVKTTVLEIPRTKIITETEDYLHAECSSATFGFVDDLELHLRSSEGMIAIRSASRLGYSDFGVNRERIETLRSSLKEQGITN